MLQMRKISVLSLMFVLGSVSGVNAGANADGHEYRSDWGLADNMSSLTCKGTGADAGFTKTNTGSEPETKTDGKWHGWLKKYATDDQKGDWAYGAVYYVAHEMADHGYYFCKTVLQADRSGCTTDTFMTYYSAGDCFWLCEPGYSGDGCETKAPDTVKIDLTPFTKRDKAIKGGYNVLVSTKDLRKGGNIAGKIPMFYSAQTTQCSGGVQVDLMKMTKKQEHNVILVLKNVVSLSGKWTFTLQPMVVRAGGAKGCLGVDDTAWPMVSWVGTESTKFCPSAGFQYDTAQSACVENTETVTTETTGGDESGDGSSASSDKLNKLCPTYSVANYDSTKHELVAATYNDADCYNIKCRNAKMGFYEEEVTSDSVISCISCTPAETTYGLLYGVDAEGHCISCEIGQVFNSTTKQCEKATVFSKTQLRGDAGVKKVSDACWTKDNPTDYMDCVKKVK